MRAALVACVLSLAAPVAAQEARTVNLTTEYGTFVTVQWGGGGAVTHGPTTAGPHEWLQQIPHPAQPGRWYFSTFNGWVLDPSGVLLDANRNTLSSLTALYLTDVWYGVGYHIQTGSGTYLAAMANGTIVTDYSAPTFGSLFYLSEQ
jgi:hypothetical protein